VSQPALVGDEHVARDEAGPNAASDGPKLALPDQAADVLLGATELDGNLSNRQAIRLLHPGKLTTCASDGTGAAAACQTLRASPCMPDPACQTLRARSVAAEPGLRARTRDQLAMGDIGPAAGMVSAGMTLGATSMSTPKTRRAAEVP
jgi:hypothetical protein